MLDLKKVLFIGMTPNLGGLETFMINIFSRLQGHGFSFSFINLYGDKSIAYYKYIIHNNGLIFNVKFKKNYRKYLSRYRIAKHFFSQHHDYDVIHLNTLSLNWLYWLKAANKFGIKNLIVHSHNDSDHIYHSKIKLLFASLLMKYNQFYLKLHPNIKELAASNSCGKWMFGNNHFQIIPNGIDIHHFKFNSMKRLYWRKRLGINSSVKVIISVARLSYQKNYYKIIHIFNDVHKLDSSAILVIVGDGPEKSNITYLIHALGLSKNVLLLGAINNVSSILNVADLMLMPSRYEGFPFSLIESQSSGVPALVSDGVIPPESNVTNTLKYLSLSCSDVVWAREAYYMLQHSPDMYKKYKMNQMVGDSKYNIKNMIDDMKQIYLK